MTSPLCRSREHQHFDAHFSQLVILMRANAHLTCTRDLLLPRLISGKLREDDLAIQFPPSMAIEAAAQTVLT